MAGPDPVKDTLPEWKPDAGSADTNEPQPTSSTLYTSSTAIDGEFRRIKSEMRSQTLEPQWVRYTIVPENVDQLDPPDNTPITVVSGGDADTPAEISLPGDWTGLVAIDQRVQAWVNNTPFYGKITDVALPGPGGGNTIIRVLMDSGQSLSACIELRMGIWNPQSSVLPFGAGVPLPIPYGGTGNTLGQPSGVAGGDLRLEYPNPLVQGIQGNPVVTAEPADMDVMYFDEGGEIFNFAQIAALDPNVTARIALLTQISASGYIKLPVTLGGGSAADDNIIIQWATSTGEGVNGTSGTFTVALPIPFPNAGLIAIINMNRESATARPLIVSSGGFANAQDVRVNWASTGSISDTATVFIIAIGS